MADYDDVYATIEEGEQKVEDSRNEAMDWLTTYYESPETIDLVSENMEALLAPDSNYMLGAQTASREAREASGYLDSGFNTGIGTVAAIDNAFDTALSDTYVNMFNAYEDNEQLRQEYKTAYELAMETMLFQDEQSYKEANYDILLSLGEQRQEGRLEISDKAYEYADLLQSSQHEDNLDRLYLKQAADIANRVARSQSGLQAYYLQSYTGIINSNISQGDKYDQLLSLGGATDEANKAIGEQQYYKIGDNPYDISYIDTIPGYNIGDEGDEAFNWTVSDALFEYVKFKETFDPIYTSIHEQTNHQERDASTLWTVVNDLLGTQLNSIDKNSQEFIDKMEFFNRTKYDRLGNDPSNDEIQAYFYDMYKIGLTIADKRISPMDKIDPYRPPSTSTKYTWNSETEVIDASKITIPGSDLYYERAACRWPMVWQERTESCIAQEG